MTSKTFAIITDIHSNISALNYALDIIDSRKNVDQIICLGDCFSLGPEPEKTLKKLKEINNCIFVRGNHDRYIIEKLWEEEVIEDLPSLPEGMEGMEGMEQILGNTNIGKIAQEITQELDIEKISD